MRFIKLSSILLLALGLSLHAAEHGGGGGGEGGEAGAEGGEGKVAKPPRDQREYTEKTNKMNALAGKIEEGEKRFKELVHEKEETKSAAAKAPILKEMVEVSQQRAKDEKEFNKLKTELQQRYPNQGTHVNRHAEKAESAEHGEHGEHAEHAEKTEHGEHEKEKSAKVNAAPSLDDLIKETKTLMDQKYAAPGDRAKLEERKPASEKEVIRPRLRLER